MLKRFCIESGYTIATAFILGGGIAATTIGIIALRELIKANIR